MTVVTNIQERLYQVLQIQIHKFRRDFSTWFEMSEMSYFDIPYVIIVKKAYWNLYSQTWNGRHKEIIKSLL